MQAQQNCVNFVECQNIGCSAPVSRGNKYCSRRCAGAGRTGIARPISSFWTAEKEALLEELSGRDPKEYPYRRIAEIISEFFGDDCTKNMVVGKVRRSELPSRKSPMPPQPWYAHISGSDARKCVWPSGHPGDPNFSFCGEPVTHGPYCAAHAARGYIPESSLIKRREALPAHL